MGRQVFSISQRMQEHEYPCGYAFVALLKACTARRHLDRGFELHAEIARTGLLERDFFVGSSLVDMYAKCGSLAKAREVFDKLAIRDVVSWTALIGGYAEHGHGMEALSYVEQMESEGILPDSHTIVCSLKACGTIGAIDIVQELHTQIVNKGLERELFVGNALVDLYARYGLLGTAQDVFNKTLIRDVVSWNALITGYAEHEHEEEMFHCFEKMHHEGISLNAITYVCGLKACGGIGAVTKGQELHFDIVLKGLEREILIGNALVDMYSKCGLLVAAEVVFDKLLVQDVVCWTALLAGYIEHGRGEEALDCVEQMRQEGAFLNVVTYICTLKACSSIGAKVKGKIVHMEIVKKGLERELLVGNSLVDMYAKGGLLVTAWKVFDMLPIRDVVLWNALMTGYAEHGFNADVLDCLEWMQHDGIPLNSVTFICSFKACGGIKAIVKGCELHAESIKRGYEKEIYVGSTLVDMYAKCGLHGEAQNVLDRLGLQNVVSQNALMAGYAQRNCGEEALEYFQHMQRYGASMNAPTYVRSLKACGSLGALVNGQEIHAEAIRKGLERDLIVGSSLVDMYAKCGLVAEAQEVLINLPVRDSLSWNSLITGFSQLGESECAFSIFSEMISDGIRPDVVTFVSILNACSHVGLVTAGLRCFGAVLNDYGLIPTLEHYNCIIDLLGRAGCMDEVVGMIKELPLHPDIVVWHTVLGACRKWGDVELGRHVLEHALLLDKNDVGACISMFNISMNAYVEEVYKGKTLEM